MWFRILAVLLVAIGSGPIQFASAAERPNILFIAVDDLNDFVGCMGGHPDAVTPNIDRLARRGTLFTNAHCAAPICGPSRAALMIGQHPATTGIYGQIHDKDLQRYIKQRGQTALMSTWFADHGYHTMCVGKIYHQGGGAGAFEEDGGRMGAFGPKPAKRMNYDPAWFDNKHGHTQTDWGAFPDRDDDMPDYKSADWAIQRLQRQYDKPFFLAVGMQRPHVPWHVPQKWFDKFQRDALTMPAYQRDDLADVPPAGVAVNEAPMMPDTEWAIANKQWPAIIQAYLACVMFADAQVGRVLDALDDSPYADNTIIVLWSDHGYHLGEKNHFSKQTLWERSSHMPLIIAGPNLPDGQRVAAPVSLVDLYPTLLEMTSLPSPPQTLEGHSLTPLLRDPAADWPHMAMTNYGWKNTALRDARYRYIQYDDGSNELYDHQVDPNEWHNLADDPASAAVVKRFQSHLPKRHAKWSQFSRYDFNEYLTANRENHR